MKYKTYADKYKCIQEFNEGDIVMVRLRPERYPSGTVKKLHSANPFKVKKKGESNAYLFYLPESFGIRNIFNVTNILLFTDPFAI